MTATHQLVRINSHGLSEVICSISGERNAIASLLIWQADPEPGMTYELRPY